MTPIIIFASVLFGFSLGLTTAWLLRFFRVKSSQDLVQEFYRLNESLRQGEIQKVVDNVKASFGSLSLEALSRSSDELIKMAQSRLESERSVHVRELESKKHLIDQQLSSMNQELEKVAKLMKDLEVDRVEKFGELTNQLKNNSEQVLALAQTTQVLKEALVNTKARGQLGEKLAEDVLRLVGFTENINYQKQKMIDGIGSKPDFTFMLPQERRLNMDVKFPMSSYLRYLEAGTKIEKDQYLNQFIKDVRLRIKEVTTRDYINSEQNTLDYVLLFIPNEQIYGFIQSADSSMIEEALKNRVVFCSPLTLFAILSVIRQALDNFAMEKASKEMLSLFGAFKKQWGLFLVKMEVLGKKLSDAHEAFEQLSGARQKGLEAPLNKIEELRKSQGLPVAQDDSNDAVLISEDKLD